MCQLRLSGGIIRLIQEVEDLCKGSDNILRQLLYEGVSAARTEHTSKGDIYDTFGGPILMILYHTNTILKAIVCRKSVGVVKTDNICYMRVPTSLIMTTIGGIKS